MTERIKEKAEQIKAAVLDDKKRIKLQFEWVYGVLAAVSFFMTVINIFTAKIALMCATLIFGLLCCLNIALTKRNEKTLEIAGRIFSVELILLLTFFVVSGTPEGFSAIWACLLPASGLLLFGRKKGAILCVIQLLILVFFFETPLGNSFLMYPYTASFKLRFPMLYVAFFVLSFLLEMIRSVTFDEMKKAQAKYEYLYRHDALTEVYNRYGFNEKMEALLGGGVSGKISMLILDIDHFKQVNDTYGHPFGDVVLKKLAALLVRKAGAEADVSRWGGEEFAVLFVGDKDAVAYGNDILNTMRNTSLLVGDCPVRITASIGIAIFEDNSGVTPSEFVRLADRCLYEAKEKGRNTLVCRQGGAAENSRDLSI